MTLGSILRRAALLWPNRVALVDVQGRSFSYREWNERVNQLANALMRLGIGTRDAGCVLVAQRGGSRLSLPGHSEAGRGGGSGELPPQRD